MLDKQDIQIIKELIEASEERTQAKMDAMETRLQSNMDAMEARLQTKIDDVDSRWQAYAEGSIVPNFQLLAEGHQTLLETLAPKSRVDNLEDDVIFLKSIVKSLMQEVSDLKKAQ